MNHDCGMNGIRSSALWGTGGKGGEIRSRRLLVAVAALLALAGPFASSALAGSPNATNKSAFVPTALVKSATASPTKVFRVIVRGRPGESSASIATAFNQGGGLGHLKRQFYSVNGVAGQLTGSALLKLAQNNHVLSIVIDAKMGSTGLEESTLWQAATNILPLAGTALLPAPAAPAIAIVDSGVDSSKLADFGARVVASVNFQSSNPLATGDDEGHGTMVAGIAAGAGLYTGVAPNAPIVNLRTADARGASSESDVIAAIDWILQNRAQYDIRVANFSMRSSSPSSFRYDPLDAAVEKLWFSGVTVVAAVGNYGTGTAMQVQYAPGNDPFVISVGALDTNGTADPHDDFAASWSAFGHTLDGFSKPEISAPGRWIAAPIPMTSTLATTAPDRIVAAGYMWMSGTSLAAPMVTGAAAQILARHPGWTPDQVKGALMESASRLTTAGFAGGVGELNGAAAAALATAPNPNVHLWDFVTTAADGTKSFDGNAWMTTVQANPAWSATDWSATDWSATDWSATDWSATDWSATDWSATDWSATDWSATDWSATDWSATDWSE